MILKVMTQQFLCSYTHTHTLVGVLLLVGSSSLVLLDMEVMILKVMTQQFLCPYTHTHTGWGVAVRWIIFSCATGYGGNGSKSHDSTIFYARTHTHTHTHTHTGLGVAVSWIIFSCATGYGGRVKLGIFGQTAKFGQQHCLFHISNIGIKNKSTKQTVKILMRRLIRSRLIRIYTVCKCVSEFT